MPELPEVETIRQAIARHAAGRSVTSVSGRAVQMRRPLDPDLLDRRLRNRRIVEPRRRGKFLLIDLEPSGSLLVHLGMSGRLLFERPGARILPHTHLVLHLDNDLQLRLVDPRRFGLAVWLEPGAEAADPSLAGLGTEPLDERLPVDLPALLHARRSPLKALLLDQTLIAGIGNIYATEALWRSGIRPLRRGHRTSVQRLEKLMREIQNVLLEAIQAGGTTIRDYATPGGDFGSFALRLQVYGRAGEACPRCGTSLRDTRIGGRSTVWCVNCQR